MSDNPMTGHTKFVGTVSEGYSIDKFKKDQTYSFIGSNGKYDIYDRGLLIESVTLRTFNKCFEPISEGLNLQKKLKPFELPLFKKIRQSISFEEREDGLYVAKLLDKTDTFVDLNELYANLEDDDMTIESFDTEWLYIADPNNNKVYHITGYNKNHINTLNKKGWVVFPVSPMKYEEYLLDEGLNLQKKIRNKPNPGTRWEKVYNHLRLSPVGRNVQSFEYTSLDKIILKNGNKEVVVIEGLENEEFGFYITFIENGTEIKDLFVNPKDDNLFILTIEDTVDNFLFDPNMIGGQPINEGRLNLPKASPKNKIEVSSDLIPILSVNMYNTDLDPESVLFRELEQLSQEAVDKYWEFFDHKKYDSFILDEARSFIKTEITPEFVSLNIGIGDINVIEIHSPKSYNYGGDVLNFDIMVYNVEVFTEKVLNDIYNDLNQEELSNFLQNKYKSYPGFSSFMPQSIAELGSYIKDPSLNNFERGISAYLSFKLGSNFKEWDQDFNQKIFETYVDLMDFVPEMPDDVHEKIIAELNGEPVNWAEDDEELNENKIILQKKEKDPNLITGDEARTFVEYMNSKIMDETYPSYPYGIMGVDNKYGYYFDEYDNKYVVFDNRKLEFFVESVYTLHQAQEWVKEQFDVVNNECKQCHGEGCESCHQLGYEMNEGLNLPKRKEEEVTITESSVGDYLIVKFWPKDELIKNSVAEELVNLFNVGDRFKITYKSPDKRSISINGLGKYALHSFTEGIRWAGHYNFYDLFKIVKGKPDSLSEGLNLQKKERLVAYDKNGKEINIGDHVFVTDPEIPNDFVGRIEDINYGEKYATIIDMDDDAFDIDWSYLEFDVEFNK